MDTYKNQSFLKLTVRFGLVFFIVVTVIKVLVSMVKNGGVSGMVAEYFSTDTWQQFVTLQFAMSIIYGVCMAGYYKFIKK